MFFKKKGKVKIKVVNEGEITKLIIDYFDKKDKQQFRAGLLRNILEKEENFLVMVDTNFFSKMEESHEREWSHNLKEWLEDEKIEHQIMKAKKETPTGLLGSLYNTKKNKKDNFAFRIGAITDTKEFDTLLGYHDQVKMGLHIGVGIKKDDRNFLLREYCTGLIDEYNRFEFYEIDIYDYLEVGRMVINCNSLEKIDLLRIKINDYLN